MSPAVRIGNVGVGGRGWGGEECELTVSIDLDSGYDLGATWAQIAGSV